MNPFRRILNFFRPKPGVIGLPRYAHEVPANPRLHALDFAERYALPMDYHVATRMTELGIPRESIGIHDPDEGGLWRAFIPHGTQGGAVLGEEIGVDSGVFNDDLLKADYDEKARKLFERSRLRDRLDAIIVHEFEEQRCGTHVGALMAAPTTALPVNERVREILRAMEKGWKR